MANQGTTIQEDGPEETPTGKRMSLLAKTLRDEVSHEMQGEHETSPGANERVSRAEVERIIEGWPEANRAGAKLALERYGPPNEATPVRVIWYDNGPWKRTIVTREVLTHKFPMRHTDFVTNVIDYHVPPEKFEELARFDGSCLPDRTAGEVAARCDSEWANILTLNLMHEIVEGHLTVEEAREKFAETASAYALGRDAPYAEQLQFTPSSGGTEDPDESIIAAPMVEQMAEKMKDTMGG